MNSLERRMLDAVPHRHTHRGPFAPGPLPHGLLASLQHDALAEGATLTLVTGGLAYDRLEQIVAAAARRQGADPRTRPEIRRWTRMAADPARDGIPVTALAGSAPAARPGGYPSATSTSAVASPVSRLAGRPRPPRPCS